MPKHASIYSRADSPYWWIAYWSPAKLKRVAEATPYRKDDHGSKRKALVLATERSQEAVAARQETGSEWSTWVEPWIKLKHRGSMKTLRNYVVRWRHIHGHLMHVGVHAPRFLPADYGPSYIEWRMSQVRPASKKSPSYNTCLLELSILSQVMREAIRRGYADSNPVERLGLKRDRAPEKPEITDDEVRQIREVLKGQPEWMVTSFEIAIHQGCRLTETQIPLERVDLESAPPRVQFHAKQHKVFTTQLHPALVPMMQRFKAEGRRVTCELPRMAAKEWHFFFRDVVKLPHLCFHCTRVTVVTRMARAGVPIQQAMAYVGHANTLIHRIYQRLRPADVGSAVDALRIPGG